jgi:hypothetical protein
MKMLIRLWDRSGVPNSNVTNEPKPPTVAKSRAPTLRTASEETGPGFQRRRSTTRLDSSSRKPTVPTRPSADA